MKYEFTKVEDLVMKRRNAPCLLANNLPRDRKNLERMYGNVRIIADGMKTRPFYLNLDIIKEMIEADPKFFAQFGIGVVEIPEEEEEEEEVNVEEELNLDEVDDIPFADPEFKDFGEEVETPVVDEEGQDQVEESVVTDTVPEEEVTPEPPKKLIEDMSYNELKDELTNRGIEFKGNISKKDAIALLKEE